MHFQVIGLDLIRHFNTEPHQITSPECRKEKGLVTDTVLICRLGILSQVIHHCWISTSVAAPEPIQWCVTCSAWMFASDNGHSAGGDAAHPDKAAQVTTSTK